MLAEEGVIPGSAAEPEVARLQAVAAALESPTRKDYAGLKAMTARESASVARSHNVNVHHATALSLLPNAATMRKPRQELNRLEAQYLDRGNSRGGEVITVDDFLSPEAFAR